MVIQRGNYVKKRKHISLSKVHPMLRLTSMGQRNILDILYL